MDIWEKLYHEAKALYAPQEVSDFVYARHVVAAVEAADGQILRAFVWKEPVASFIYVPTSGTLQHVSTIRPDQGQAHYCFRDKPPYGEGSGMPCGACREFLLELNAENRHLEFMVDYESRKTITLGELMPLWWGEARARQIENKGNE